MGIMGRAFGDHEHAPTNCVFLIVFIVLVIMGIMSFMEPSMRAAYFEVLKTVGVAGLGFIGAKLGGKKAS